MSHTSDSLAAEFLARSRAGNRKLSAKQGQWLYDLATGEASVSPRPRGILPRRWLTARWVLIERADGEWRIGEVNAPS